MTKDEKISNFERVLSWLPEAFKSWASSNPFLSSTLNEVLNERDTRLSGTPCASRLMTAVTALLQKLQDRRDKSAALILAASREAEETALELATRMSEGTGLKISATTGVRDGAGLTAVFTDAPDLVVTNPKVLEKAFEKGFAVPEAFRTILIDGAEWHEVMGDTDRIASLCERFSAARQLIVTGPVTIESTEDPYNAMLHAPAFCRAPDEAPREAAPKERVLLVPEDKLSEVLAQEAEKAPVLFLASTPSESTRITGLLKDAGIAAKRATAAQSASARETLILKFIAGRIDHLVMPHAVLGELEHNRVSHMVLTDLSGGPEPYLEHLSRTADGTGELVSIVTPETLPLFEKLLVAAEKRLTLENPYNLPEPRTVIGQLLRREKLTIRTDYARTAEPDGDAPEEEHSRKERRKPYERKGQNGQRKDRKEGFRKNKKDFKKDGADKNFGKKPRKAFKPREDDFPPVKSVTTEAEIAAPQQTAPVDNSAPEQAQADKPRKFFKDRRYGKKRSYKRRQEEGAAETSVTPAEAQVVPAEYAPETAKPQESAPVEGNDAADKPRKSYSKNFRRKPRKFQSADGNERQDMTQEDAAPSMQNDQAPHDDARPQEKKRFQKKPRKPAAQPKPREQEWDEDNFGNSIHYQPKRQNLRGLRDDQTIHWEPSDPYHPSSQALSLPQIMPDEYRQGGYVNGNVNGNVKKGGFKNGFNKNRKNYRKKREG